MKKIEDAVDTDLHKRIQANAAIGTISGALSSLRVTSRKTLDPFAKLNAAR